jgi:hypothetical protein
MNDQPLPLPCVERFLCFWKSWTSKLIDFKAFYYPLRDGPILFKYSVDLNTGLVQFSDGQFSLGTGHQIINHLNTRQNEQAY